MSALLAEVRKIDNLYVAWRKVRANIVSSGHARFRTKVDEIDKNPIRLLRKIQSRLQRGTFAFDKQTGRLKDGRPLVVSSIENRIVHRAILNVLQSEDISILQQLGGLPGIIRSENSVGGVPGRNVEYGIERVVGAIKQGAQFYIRSDIQKFYTRVPRGPVIQFVEDETSDKEFANFFGEALKTELENKGELYRDIGLFPDDKVGVQQGSALSALAGNILLREFDTQMNGRGITTIRYIDDFVMLGNKRAELLKAFSHGSGLMKSMGLEIYDPAEPSDKASMGCVGEGFTFLGCRIEGKNVSASKKACLKILEDVANCLKSGNKSINKLLDKGNVRRTEAAIAQTLALLDDKVRGWGDAFAFTNNRLPMERLDEKISADIESFVGRNYRLLQARSVVERQRALGVTLLRDIPKYHLTKNRPE